MKSNIAVDHWLEMNPEWVLAAKLKNEIKDESKYKEIISKSEFGFITQDGSFYSRLRDTPTFVGIKQVVKKY